MTEMDMNGTVRDNTTISKDGIRDPVLGGTLLTIDIFIVIFNSLAVMVIMRFRTKNCIDILVLGLAMTDLTKGLIPVPMSVATYLTRWYMQPNTAACDFFGWIAFATNSASMLILTIMAMERFLAIVKPFSYRALVTKRRMEISVLLAVIFSSFISILPIFGLGRMTSFNEGAYCHFDYTHRSKQSEIYSIFILIYGLALVFVVLAAYSIVFYKIRDLIKRHKRFAISCSISSKSSKMTKKRGKGEINLKVEKMFSYLTLGLMLLFWFSWFPFLAVLMLNLIMSMPLSHDKVDLFAMRVAVVNAMLNPIACASFCKPYRRGFIYYYKKLLSYAGFARPDSDVFDPWRQKSRDHTREQASGNSFAAQHDNKKQSRYIVDFDSHVDSIDDPELSVTAIPSVLEPLYNRETTAEGEGFDYDDEGERDLVPLDVCFQCNKLVNTEDGDKGCLFDYNELETDVIHWKQNRISQDVQNHYADDGKNYLKKEGMIMPAASKSQPKRGKSKTSKLKRYSMPVGCIYSDEKKRPLSFGGITKNRGKYRPWSTDLNEKFPDWFQGKAIENNVKLIGYADLNMKQVGRFATTSKFTVSNNNNFIEAVIKRKELRSCDKEESSAQKQRNSSKHKYQSNSAPTISEKFRLKDVVKFSSLGDELDKSFQQMDLVGRESINSLK